MNPNFDQAADSWKINIYLFEALKHVETNSDVVNTLYEQFGGIYSTYFISSQKVSLPEMLR